MKLIWFISFVIVIVDHTESDQVPHLLADKTPRVQEIARGSSVQGTGEAPGTGKPFSCLGTALPRLLGVSLPPAEVYGKRKNQIGSNI